jgi:hypothetical protein
LRGLVCSSDRPSPDQDHVKLNALSAIRCPRIM